MTASRRSTTISAHDRALRALLMGSIVFLEPEEHFRGRAISRRHMRVFLDTGTVEDVQRFIEDNGLLRRDQNGRIPLHYACIFGKLDMVKDFLDQNEAEAMQMLSMRDNKGATPLHLAVHNGNLQIVQYMVENGSNVNEPTNPNPNPYYYSPPLFLALEQGNEAVVEYLLKKGANIKFVKSNGKTPLSTYYSITPMNHHNWKIFTLLVEYGMKAEEKMKTLGGLLLQGPTYHTTILDWYLQLTESEVIDHLIPSILAAVPEKENPTKALLHYLLSVNISNGPGIQNSIKRLIKLIRRMSPNAIPPDSYFLQNSIFGDSRKPTRAGITCVFGAILKIFEKKKYL